MMLVLFLLHLQSKHYIPDSAISSMLKFLYTFFTVISRVSQIGKTIADSFEHLVVCPECNSVYRLKDCIRRQGVSELCRHQEFHSSRKCGASLLKTVELASGKKILYPIKVYCYIKVL